MTNEWNPNSLADFLSNHSERLVPAWKSRFESIPDFQTDPLKLHVEQALNPLLLDLCSSLLMGTPRKQPFAPPTAPLDPVHMELKFLLEAERCLMDLLLQEAPSDYKTQKSVRSILNKAFHQIIRARINHSCACCHATLQEDLNTADYIEREIEREPDPMP